MQPAPHGQRRKSRARAGSRRRARAGAALQRISPASAGRVAKAMAFAPVSCLMGRKVHGFKGQVFGHETRLGGYCDCILFGGRRGLGARGRTRRRLGAGRGAAEPARGARTGAILCRPAGGCERVLAGRQLVRHPAWPLQPRGRPACLADLSLRGADPVRFVHIADRQPGPAVLAGGGERTEPGHGGRARGSGNRHAGRRNAGAATRAAAGGRDPRRSAPQRTRVERRTEKGLADRVAGGRILPRGHRRRVRGGHAPVHGRVAERARPRGDRRADHHAAPRADGRIQRAADFGRDAAHPGSAGGNRDAHAHGCRQVLAL